MKKKYILIGVIISFFGCISLIEAASYGTDVEYTGLGEETYYIEVPAKLSPGESGEVKVYGSWPSDKMVSVSADKTVTLTNEYNAFQTKKLDIYFDNIELYGNDSEEVSLSKNISISNMGDDVLFGVWSGRFNYNVSMSSNVSTPTFSMLYKPSNTLITPESTFSVAGYDVYSGLGNSDDEGYKVFSFLAKDEYHVVVNGLPFEVDEVVNNDFEAIYYGEESMAHIDTNLLGVSASDLADYTFIMNWPGGTSTAADFSIEPFQVTDGLTMDIPCITYRYFNESGKELFFTGGPYSIWFYDSNTKTFTLASPQDTLSDGMIFYIDSNNVLTDTALKVLNN